MKDLMFHIGPEAVSVGHAVSVVVLAGGAVAWLWW